MSWTVNVIQNTLKGNRKKLNRIALEIEDDYFLQIGKNGEIIFDSDAMEHVDFIGTFTEGGIVKNLIAAGVVGRVCFADCEGTTDGRFWGYEFKDGRCRELVGEVMWQNAGFIE